MFTSKSLTAYEILQSLYVDDIGIPFGTRKDLQQGMELIFHHFTRFGLEMHIGRGETLSKMECVFFLPPQFFQHKCTREKAAIKIQQAYRHTHNSREKTTILCIEDDIRDGEKNMPQNWNQS